MYFRRFTAAPTFAKDKPVAFEQAPERIYLFWIFSFLHNYRSYTLVSIVSLIFCILFSVCDTTLSGAPNRVTFRRLILIGRGYSAGHACRIAITSKACEWIVVKALGRMFARALNTQSSQSLHRISSLTNDAET